MNPQRTLLHPIRRDDLIVGSIIVAVRPAKGCAHSWSGRQRYAMCRLPVMTLAFAAVGLLAIPSSVAAAAAPTPAVAAPVPLPFLKPEVGNKQFAAARAFEREGDAPGVVVRGETGQTLTPVLEVENPPVASHRYVVRGRLKHEDVKGAGYLEMWSDFGEKGAFFSRTMAAAGPSRSLIGTSGWRDFELPFVAEPGMKPKRISINVVLSGKGTVYLGPMTLGALPEDPGWWNAQQTGMFGGIAGGLLGLLGAAIGVLAGRCRAKPVVMTLITLGLVLGAVSLFGGVVALTAGQPYHVTYPLFLLGGIAVLVLGFNLPGILRRYRTEELRRMTALDA